MQYTNYNHQVIEISSSNRTGYAFNQEINKQYRLNYVSIFTDPLKGIGILIY